MRRANKHRFVANREEILRDFDLESRTLRITFVGPQGRLFGVTYKLCPLCGVTMEEQAPGGGFRYRCTLCGLISI